MPSQSRRSLVWYGLSMLFVWVLIHPADLRADDTDSDENQSGQLVTVILSLVDGTRTSGRLNALDGESIALQVGGGDDRSWSLSDVMWIAPQSKTRMQIESPPLVMLANDDVLCGVVTAVDEETLTLDWQVTSPPTSVSIPLETVRSIVFRQPDEPLSRTRIQRLWALLNTKSDRLISTDYTHVDGELTGLDDGNVQLKTALANVSAPVEELFAVILNSELLSAPPLEGAYVLAALRDGSRVTWDSMELTSEGNLTGTTVWGTTLSAPANQIAQLQFLGDRVVAVAELTPSKYVFTPYLTEQHPLIRNRNVRGGPLRLRGTSYATGLGVHSKCAVTYDLTDDGYQQFRAVVGVDDVTQGDGNVVFAVEVDGRRVYESPALSGRSRATAIDPINLRGAKSLTLIVDFGELANINDVADWCNAVLIKAAQ